VHLIKTREIPMTLQTPPHSRTPEERTLQYPALSPVFPQAPTELRRGRVG